MVLPGENIAEVGGKLEIVAVERGWWLDQLEYRMVMMDILFYDKNIQRWPLSFANEGMDSNQNGFKM